MSRNFPLLSLSALMVSLVVMAPASADVYKYKDEKGNTLYTDRPVALPAERLNIQSQRSDVVEMEQRTNNETKTAAELDKARQQAQADKKKASEAAAAPPAPSKEESCNKARQDYLSRMNSARLYEEQPNGERRYLADAELDATRSAAKQAMDALCN